MSNNGKKLNIETAIKMLCEFQNLFEGFDEISGNKKLILTIKHKILLYLLNGEASPYKLISKIGIAKTNLNLVCKEMIESKLITKKREDFDKRVIVYSITEKGKEKLFEDLSKFSENFVNSLGYKNNIDEINDNINKLYKLLS